MVETLIAALEARQKLGRQIMDHDGEITDELRAEVDAADAAMTAALEDQRQAEQAAHTREIEITNEVGSRVSFRNYLIAAARERPLDGAEAELNSELGLDRNQVPWTALLPRDEPSEQRQDVPTRAPSAGYPRDQMTTLDRVFAATDAAWIGVQMPTVARGNPVYPVLTGGTTPANRAVGAAIEAEAATFETTMITPTRITARYLFGLEDVAQFEGLEETLRTDLRMALGSHVDDQILTGNGTAPNFSGLLRELGSATDATTGLATHDQFASLGAAGVDGVYASVESQVRFLIGVDTYRFGAGLIQTGDGDSAMQHLMERGVMVRASSRLPDIASKKQEFVRRSGTGVGAEAIAPVWEGLELIRDPYTGAARGQVAVTAIMLCGFDVVRHDAYHLGRIQIRA